MLRENKPEGLTAGEKCGWLIAAFIVLAFRLIKRDFFYDEVWSLVHFILVPIKQTVWEYKNMNNHFFYSLLMNLYMKTVFIIPWIELDPNFTPEKDILHLLMRHPWVVRLPQFSFSFVTICYLYKIAAEFISTRAAVISSVILITTIPLLINWAK